MTIEYDEKGKFYTEVVTKVPTAVVIQTTTHLVRGLVHVRQGERLKDELEVEERFIAVTNFTIHDTNDNVTFSGAFLAILRAHIVWITPADEASHGG